MTYYRLLPRLQHYDWGGFRFLPELLGQAAPSERPCAELWMGAHPGAPAAILLDGREAPLPELIAADPQQWLGRSVSERFDGQLPFLFKILDVRKMLSIQAHPNIEKAREGFRRENEQGIPFTAAHRVYKDPNHKPEVMAALSDFWLLHGFKSPQDIATELERVPEWRPLLEHFSHRDTAALYCHLMLMPQSEVDALLLPLRVRLEPLFVAGDLPKSSPDYWAALAFRDFELPGGHCDRGIFSIYLLHLAHIPQGQGIFQAAGVPHAYLEGQNVELMANSDNVFRGGLTPKYIAVEELLDNLVFEPTPPRLIEGSALNEVETVYPTPAPDFELSRLELPAGTDYSFTAGAGPEMLLVMQGEVVADTGEVFHQGEVMYLLPETECSLQAAAHSVLFKAAVPGGGGR